MNRQAITGQLLSVHEWESSEHGYCDCPGQDLHTHHTAPRHCSVHLDGAPTIHCFHTSCAGAIEAANLTLRRAIGAAERGDIPGIGTTRPQLTPKQKERIKKKRTVELLKARTAASLPLILRDWPWTPAEAWEDSPTRLLGDPSQDWRYLFTLFAPDDVFWIGDKYDSGKPEHTRHFATPTEHAERILRDGVPPLTCPSTFKPGTCSRCNEAVLHRRYLVIESDTLSKDEMAGIIRWCRQFMYLRAIVDTAGKSLHGWFEFPDDTVIEELKAIFTRPNFDPSLFKPSQPCRLPGAPRNGNTQSLLYFDGGAASE